MYPCLDPLSFRSSDTFAALCQGSIVLNRPLFQIIPEFFVFSVLFSCENLMVHLNCVWKGYIQWLKTQIFHLVDHCRDLLSGHLWRLLEWIPGVILLTLIYWGFFFFFKFWQFGVFTLLIKPAWASCTFHITSNIYYEAFAGADYIEAQFCRVLTFVLFIKNEKIHRREEKWWYS